MITSSGSIKDVYHNRESSLSQSALYNGIYRYTQVALVQGLGDAHRSHFLIGGITPAHTLPHAWETAGQFVWNETPQLLASRKVYFLLHHPEIALIPETNIGATREEQPAAIRLPLIDIRNPSEHEPGFWLILASSSTGILTFADIMLIAAFAIGVNEVAPAWDLTPFNTDEQYAWALKSAARFIVFAEQLNANYKSSIQDDSWHDWMDKAREPFYPSDIMQQAFGTIQPDEIQPYRPFQSTGGWSDAY